MLRSLSNPSFSLDIVNKIQIDFVSILHIQFIYCRNCLSRIVFKIPESIHKKIISCERCLKRYSLSIFTPLYRMKIPVPSFLCIVKGFLTRRKPRIIFDDLKYYGYSMTEKTLYTYLLRLRRLVTKYMAHYLKYVRLSGTIEIDECVLTSQKQGWGSGRFPTMHLWVFGLIERETKRSIVYLVPNRRSQTIFPILAHHLHNSSRVISDDFSVYVNNRASPRVSRIVPALRDLELIHRWVNHSLRYRDTFFEDIHTNNIERLWRSLRECVPTNCSFESLNTYLKSFMFFKNFTFSQQDEIMIYMLKYDKMKDEFLL